MACVYSTSKLNQC